MRSITIIMSCLFGVSALLAGSPDRVIANFELNKGLIIVNATVDGVEGAYIVDSGAPGLVLNATYQTERGASVELAGITGKLSGTTTTPVTLEFQDFTLNELDAMSIDLSYLEHCVHQEIHGLIGLDLFEGYGILIDYASETMRLTQNAEEHFNAPHLALPITMDGHLPVIVLKNDGTVYRLGIDTGSRSNLISSDVTDRLTEVEHLRAIELVGTDQIVTVTSEILVRSLTTQGLNLGATPFVVADLSHTATGLDRPIDGILGHHFFQGRKVYLNAARTEIRIGAPAQTSTPGLIARR